MNLPRRTIRRIPLVLASCAVVAVGLIGASAGAWPASPPRASAPHYSKVLVIVEENHSYDQIIGNGQAPYINALANRYGLATNYSAGVPTSDQSLPSYFELLAGTTFGVTTDCAPSVCSQSGTNIFHQVAAAGGWRGYAQSMPGRCVKTDHRPYVVHHAPAPYFLDESGHCGSWDLPLSRLPSDLSAGRLGVYNFLAPDVNHDMHSASISAAERFLRTWMPRVMAGPDYRAGRLAIFVTWDEGSHGSNHIPTLVISPTTSHIRSATSFTHASLLRTCEELLGVPLLRDARTAPSMRAAFNLG